MAHATVQLQPDENQLKLYKQKSDLLELQSILSPTSTDDLEPVCDILVQLWGDQPPVLPPAVPSINWGSDTGKSTATQTSSSSSPQTDNKLSSAYLWHGLEKKQLVGFYGTSAAPITIGPAANLTGAQPAFTYTINSISNGSTPTSRIGASVRMHRLHLRLNLNIATTEVFMFNTRAVLIYDKFVYATPIIIGDGSNTTALRQSVFVTQSILNSSTAVGNIVVGPRYEILRDKTINTTPRAVDGAGANASSGHIIDWEVDLKGKPTYWYDSSTATSIVFGGLYVCIWSDNAASSTVYGNSSLTFTDA